MKKNSIISIFFILILLLFLSLFIFNTNLIEKFQGTPSLDTTVYDIIIIAGQSNAIGRGIRNVCDSTALPGCSSGIDLRRNSSRQGAIIDISGYDFINMTKIKMFTSENDPVVENRNKIVNMRESLEHFQHRPILSSGNPLSFASSFVRQYISRIRMDSRKVLIVGCGWSGSAMLNSSDTRFPKWNKDSNDDTESLHYRTVERLRNVKNLLSATNQSKVVGLLWHQGESDMSYIFNTTETRNARKVEYKSALKETLTEMRSEIMNIFYNNNSGYTFPILLGGLSYDKQFNRILSYDRHFNRIPGGRGRDRTQFRKEMSELISEVSNSTDQYHIPRSTFVSSDSLSIIGFNRYLEGNSIMDSSGRIIGTDDNNHFSATAMREFGKRYFHYYNLIK